MIISQQIKKFNSKQQKFKNDKIIFITTKSTSIIIEIYEIYDNPELFMSK